MTPTKSDPLAALRAEVSSLKAQATADEQLARLLSRFDIFERLEDLANRVTQLEAHLDERVDRLELEVRTVIDLLRGDGYAVDADGNEYDVLDI